MGSGPGTDLARDLWRRADLCNSRLTPIRLIQITHRASEVSNSKHATTTLQRHSDPNLQQHQPVIGLIGPGSDKRWPPPSLESSWKSLSLSMLIMALVLFEERSHRPDPFAGTLTSFIRRMKPVRLIILRWVKWAICKMNYGSAQLLSTAQPSPCQRSQSKPQTQERKLDTQREAGFGHVVMSILRIRGLVSA